MGELSVCSFFSSLLSFLSLLSLIFDGSDCHCSLFHLIGLAGLKVPHFLLNRAERFSSVFLSASHFPDHFRHDTEANVYSNPP